MLTSGRALAASRRRYDPRSGTRDARRAETRRAADIVIYDFDGLRARRIARLPGGDKRHIQQAESWYVRSAANLYNDRPTNSHRAVSAPRRHRIDAIHPPSWRRWGGSAAVRGRNSSMARS